LNLRLRKDRVLWEPKIVEGEVVQGGWVKPISAREMDDAERRLYRRSPKLKPEGGELYEI